LASSFCDLRTIYPDGFAALAHGATERISLPVCRLRFGAVFPKAINGLQAIVSLMVRRDVAVYT
jgi:hypothetical protein